MDGDNRSKPLTRVDGEEGQKAEQVGKGRRRALDHAPTVLGTIAANGAAAGRLRRLRRDSA